MRIHADFMRIHVCDLGGFLLVRCGVLWGVVRNFVSERFLVLECQ